MAADPRAAPRTDVLAACSTSTSSACPSERSSKYWTYYPTSQTDHLPVVRLQGYHRDDWEGLEVAFDANGALEGARGSAHLGWNGSAPWWDERRDNWAPYSGIAYRAAGSHATGLRRGDLDLLGDGWNGDLGGVVAGSRRAARRRSGGARSTDVRPGRRGAVGEAGVERPRRVAHGSARVIAGPCGSRRTRLGGRARRRPCRARATARRRGSAGELAVMAARRSPEAGRSG